MVNVLFVDALGLDWTLSNEHFNRLNEHTYNGICYLDAFESINDPDPN